jgi:hypothetical protein
MTLTTTPRNLDEIHREHLSAAVDLIRLMRALKTVRDGTDPLDPEDESFLLLAQSVREIYGMGLSTALIAYTKVAGPLGSVPPSTELSGVCSIVLTTATAILHVLEEVGVVEALPPFTPETAAEYVILIGFGS